MSNTPASLKPHMHAQNLDFLRAEEQQDSFCGDLTHIGQNDRFQIQQKLGSGSYGTVYRATEPPFPHKHYAVKMQTYKPGDPSSLQRQMQAYKAMINYNIKRGIIDPKEHHVPQIWYFGRQSQGMGKKLKFTNVMVMDLMGRSLGSLMKQYKKIPIKTVLKMGIEMVTAVQYVHQRGIVHRDLKPDNICLSTNPKSTKIYIVDFGLANSYIHGQKHIEYTQNDDFIGNRAYCSQRAHLNEKQVRRDDMQSIGYIMVKLATGSLPWLAPEIQREANRRMRYHRLQLKKVQTKLCKLCKDLPKAIMIYIQQVRRLDFTEQPHYERYREMFRMALQQLGSFYGQPYVFK